MLLSTVLAAIISPTLSVLLTLVIGPSRVSRVAKPLSLMATGLLITLALTHLLPEAIEKAPNSHDVGLYALITVLLLIAFEMFFSIHHHHDGACKNNKHHQEVFSSGGAGLISGTALHTFCDGILIAGAFMLGNGVGIAVTLAIMAHEIPQELGDYAVLIELGLKKEQAFCINLTALIATLAGALSAHFILTNAQSLLPVALSAAAASFIYVALSDILPRVKKSDGKILMLKRYCFILSGVALAMIVSHFHLH